MACLKDTITAFG